MWLEGSADAVLFGGGAGGAGGAAGGGGRELMATGGEGFGAMLVGGAAWFSFCARATDDEAGLPPKPALGATAGGFANGWAAEFGAELLWLACRVVLAFSSSAQGAGGGRSPISGGGRKERAGLGAVGGAEGLGAAGAETWLGNFGRQKKQKH